MRSTPIVARSGITLFRKIPTIVRDCIRSALTRSHSRTIFFGNSESSRSSSYRAARGNDAGRSKGSYARIRSWMRRLFERWRVPRSAEPGLPSDPIREFVRTRLNLCNRDDAEHRDGEESKNIDDRNEEPDVAPADRDDEASRGGGGEAGESALVV